MRSPTQRLIARIERDFGPSKRDDVIGWLGALRTEEYGGQDPERVQAALVLAAAGDWMRFMDAIRLLRLDWRDALVAGGLEHQDWRKRLDQQLAPNRQ